MLAKARPLGVCVFVKRSFCSTASIFMSIVGFLVKSLTSQASGNISGVQLKFTSCMNCMEIIPHWVKNNYNLFLKEIITIYFWEIDKSCQFIVKYTIIFFAQLILNQQNVSLYYISLVLFMFGHLNIPCLLGYDLVCMYVSIFKFSTNYAVVSDYNLFLNKICHLNR